MLGRDFLFRTIVFAIVLQWRKTAFLGLKQFVFGQSSLVAIVQAIVRIVRDCTEKIIAEMRFVGLFNFFCWDKIFGSDQWFLAICDQWENRVSGFRARCFGLMGLFGICSAIDRH
jgi:hypothetical protein